MFEPHLLPFWQLGAQVGATHVPPMQRPELQSPFPPHGSPSPHVGEQAGAAHVPLVHSSELQSAFAPQASPSLHAGAHAGGWHFPWEHTLEAQAKLDMHDVPSAQSAVQAIIPGWHVRVPGLQSCEMQSAPVVHAAPLGQVGAHEASASCARPESTGCPESGPLSAG